MEDFDKEKVLDEQIQPLISQLYDICNEHGIPMMACFTYKNHSKHGADRCLTLINHIDDRKDNLIQRYYAQLSGISLGKNI